MKKYIIVALYFTFLSCKNTSNKQDACVVERNDTLLTLHQPKNFLKTNFDTSLYPFRDSSYVVEFNVFNAQPENDYKNNAVIKLIRKRKIGNKILRSDSSYCRYWKIDLKDFNGDKINDILLFNDVGARANVSYHLYIVDDRHNTIHKVKGFEKLVNPDIDTNNHIIFCVGVAALDAYYSFYRINKKLRLINLGHSFKDNPNDSTLYPNAIKQINKHI